MKNKTVQNATEQQPKSETKPEPSAEVKPVAAENAPQPKESTADASQAPAEKAFEPSEPLKYLLEGAGSFNVSPEQEKALETLGIKGIGKIGDYLKVMSAWMVQREAFESAVKSNFEELGKRMPTNKGIAEEIKKTMVEGAAQGQGSAQAGRGGGLLETIGALKEMGVLGGGGEASPLQAKMNQYMETILDNALKKATQPSTFERLLEEEIIKAKAKAMAAVVSNP